MQISILPSSSIHGNRVRGFNIYMNDIATQHNVKVIHTWGSFIKGNAVDPGLYQDDCIHLNQKGVSALALDIITQLHGRRGTRSNGQDGFHKPPHLIDNEQSQTSQSGVQAHSMGATYSPIHAEGILDVRLAVCTSHMGARKCADHESHLIILKTSAP